MEKQRHHTNTIIPADLIEDVLVKLPVKSLIRFRCVSKPWCSLITNPRFATRQLNQHRHHNSLLLECNIMHIVDHEDEELSSKISPSYRNLEHVHVFPKVLPFPFKVCCPSDYKISCYCDGILGLVFRWDGIVLWNPRIGQYNKITLPDRYLGSCEHLGFGYDSSIDDYKVVRAPVRKLEHSSFIVQVLSLKSNTWKTVYHYFPFTINATISGHQTATTFQGGIYWFADDANDTRRIALLRFDLGEEKFSEVALPPDITRWDIISSLVPAGDCLCMITKKESNLWVLKGDCTWAKLFTIPRLTGYSLNHYFRPVCFAKNGKFLIDVGHGKFLMYDSKDNTFTKFWVQGIHSWSQVIVYADSLVSPCTSNGNDREFCLSTTADNFNLTVSP